MKYYELDADEACELGAIKEALANRKSVSLTLENRKKELQRYAKNSLNKTRNINIRLSERDLQNLKSKAIEEGIPYQTLAASLLHKATTR